MRPAILFLALAGATWTAAAADAPALPRSLPVHREGAPDSGLGWSSPRSLLALLGAGGAWVAWRRTRSRTARQVTPQIVRLSSQALTPQASVHAVQWNGEELLIACTAQQVSLLARRPVAADQEPRP